MIRYVLAVLLGAAILGLGMLAVDASASTTTEAELQASITTLEEEARSLATSEELSPPGHPNPQRLVEFTIPARSLTTEGVEHVEIEPVADADASIVRYVLDDGTTNRVIVDQRIVYRDPTGDRPTELGATGTHTLRLVLLPDESGDPVVVLEPPESTLLGPASLVKPPHRLSAPAGDARV